MQKWLKGSSITKVHPSIGDSSQKLRSCREQAAGSRQLHRLESVLSGGLALFQAAHWVAVSCRQFSLPLLLPGCVVYSFSEQFSWSESWQLGLSESDSQQSLLYTLRDRGRELENLVSFRKFLKLFCLLFVLMNFPAGWNVSVSEENATHQWPRNDKLWTGCGGNMEKAHTINMTDGLVSWEQQKRS